MTHSWCYWEVQPVQRWELTDRRIVHRSRSWDRCWCLGSLSSCDRDGHPQQTSNQTQQGGRSEEWWQLLCRHTVIVQENKCKELGFKTISYTDYFLLQWLKFLPHFLPDRNWSIMSKHIAFIKKWFIQIASGYFFKQYITSVGQGRQNIYSSNVVKTFDLPPTPARFAKGFYQELECNITPIFHV